MLWIWLLARNRHRFSTGPLDRYFTFFCARCSAATAAMVRTIGYGNAANIFEAERRAHVAAEANAHRMAGAAGCPCCGQLSPATEAQYVAAAQLAARRIKIGPPIALGLMLLVLVGVGIFAVRDFHYSMWLSGVAIAASMAISAFAFAVVSGRAKLPDSFPHGVWFSRDPAQGSMSWFQAQPGPAPFVKQPSFALRNVAWVVAASSVITALVSIGMWRSTFRDVDVLNVGAHGEYVVTIDGAKVGTVSTVPGRDDDVPYTAFDVRKGAKHHVVIAGTNGFTASYDLDPATVSEGWLLAPNAHARGLCLAKLTWYYGREPPAKNDDRLLNPDVPGDFVALDKSFDVFLKAPPSTVQTQNGASETRTTLRGLDCESLDEKNYVAWATRPH